jgi:hypothetical protein
MQRRQGDIVVRVFERVDDRVLSAPPELTAGPAIGDDLLGYPGVRHDREAEMHEIRGRMRKRTQLLESGDRRAVEQFIHDALTDATTSRLACDHQGAHLRDRMTKRSQLRARHDFIIVHGDEESIEVHEDFFKLAWKQVAFGEVFVDQRADRAGVVHLGGTNLDRGGIGDGGSGIKNLERPDP